MPAPLEGLLFVCSQGAACVASALSGCWSRPLPNAIPVFKSEGVSAALGDCMASSEREPANKQGRSVASRQ